MRTPRDNFAINYDDPRAMQLVGNTPKEIKLREQALRSQLKSKFAALPKPKDLDFELELPEEQQEIESGVEMSEEDAADADRRNQALREAAERADFKRRTQVMQRNLPRPLLVDVDALLKSSSGLADPAEALIARETALLIANDAFRYPLPKANVQGSSLPLEAFDDGELHRARLQIALELTGSDEEQRLHDFEALHNSSSALPGLAGYEVDGADEMQSIMEAFEKVQASITEDAEKGNKLEKRLALINGGYQQRNKTLRQKIAEAYPALENEKITLDSILTLQIAEEAALPRRLESLQEEVAFVKKRERDAQELYRLRRAELDGAIHGQGAG